jgi:DNA-binding MarR family transcriptional regulator
VLKTSLTRAGRALVERADRATHAIEERLLSGLSAAQVNGLRDALSSCAGALGSHDAARALKPRGSRAG